MEYIKRLRGLVGGDELLQVPSVSVAVRDGDGRLLLARHAEGDVWLLPGGTVEPGEVPADAAMREMWEETGLRVRLTGLIGVFGGPDFIVHYRNGDRTSYVMSVFEAVAEDDRATPDGREVMELRYVSRAERDGFRVARWMPEVLDAIFLEHLGSFRAPGWSPRGA